MFELTSENLPTYLRERGQLAAGEAAGIRELSGGVSNAVFLVELPERGERFVIKQARPQLRVKDEWLSSIERIWREVEVLQECGQIVGTIPRLPPGARTFLPAFDPSTPQVLWEDRENYCYAMSAAVEGHKTWKELLLGRETRLSMGIATTAGTMLGTLHAARWGQTELAAKFGDRTFFDQLRLDPYYRFIARKSAERAPRLNELIESVTSHPRCLVHGDFSPKNLLVWERNVMLIDFEVGHYGDPAFDLGFFMTHLVLKAIWSDEKAAEYFGLANSFWNSYSRQMKSIPADEMAALEQRFLLNLAGCMLARVDGKSPVDYLNPQQQQTVRSIAGQWLKETPTTWQEARERLEHTLAAKANDAL